MIASSLSRAPERMAGPVSTPSEPSLLARRAVFGLFLQVFAPPKRGSESVFTPS